MRDFEYEFNKEEIERKKREEEKEKKLEIENEKLRNAFQFADEIYIFCPGINKGIMIYNQSPSGALAKFSGGLPAGKFWYSKSEMVEWDNKINGQRDDSLPVTRNVSFVTNSQKVLKMRSLKYGGGASSCNAVTIMVSQETFINLLYQVSKPTMESERNYNILDLKSGIYEKDSYMSKRINKENEEIFESIENEEKHKK